jgi:hypothetical protein
MARSSDVYERTGGDAAGGSAVLVVAARVVAEDAAVVEVEAAAPACQRAPDSIPSRGPALRAGVVISGMISGGVHRLAPGIYQAKPTADAARTQPMRVRRNPPSKT